MKQKWLITLLTMMPTFLSKRIYRFARMYFFPDPRESMVARVFEHVALQQVPGDYLEFGVYRGTSFVAAFDAATKRGLNEMRFLGFDGFDGLPESEGVTFTEGQFKSSERIFRDVVRKAGVDPQRTIVVKGLYSDSLKPEVKTEHGLRRAAVVNVDCDLYSSAREVLEFIEDLVGVGTILMFDDWYLFGDEHESHGEARAFVEWRLKDCFEVFYEREARRCKGFIMTRPAEAASDSGGTR